METAVIRHRLVECLRLVAADASEQCSAFPKGVFAPDEGALLFEEAHSLASDRGEELGLDAEVVRIVAQIDTQFAARSGSRETVWSVGAMKSDPFWEQQRELARVALKLADEPERRPALDWVHYIPGPDNSLDEQGD